MFTVKWFYRGPWWRRKFYKCVVIGPTGIHSMITLEIREMQARLEKIIRNEEQLFFSSQTLHMCKRQRPRKKYKTMIFM